MGNEAAFFGPSLNMAIDSRLPNFRALTPAQRWDYVAQACQLSDEERALIARPGALPHALADGMI